MAELQSFHQLDVKRVIFINLSKTDDIDKAKKIIKELSLESMSYFDVSGDFYSNYPIVAVPTAFHLDNEHTLLEIIRGPEDLETILEKVDEK